MAKKQTTPKPRKAPRVPLLTEARARDLASIIVPLDGCTGEDTDIVALALNELLRGLVDAKRRDDTDPSDLAMVAAEVAFEKTGAHTRAFYQWEALPFEAALKGGE